MAFNEDEIGAGKVVTVHNTGDDEAPLKFKAGQTDITEAMHGMMGEGKADLVDGKVPESQLPPKADLVGGKVPEAQLPPKADLVGGVIPASQLPSYVDDIVEGYYYETAFYEDEAHTTAITPERGKIYIDLTSNTSYRWSGTVYVQIPANKEPVMVTYSYHQQMGEYRANYNARQILEFVNEGREVYFAGRTDPNPNDPPVLVRFASMEYYKDPSTNEWLVDSAHFIQGNRTGTGPVSDISVHTWSTVQWQTLEKYYGPDDKLDPATATVADVVNYINDYIHNPTYSFGTVH